MEQEQQSNAQQQEQQRSGQQQEGNQDDQQQEKRNYSKEEWDARQAEFDRKADKIRRNAARDAELKFRREAAKSQGGEQRQEQKQETDPEPKRDDFEDYEAFMRALGRWEGRKGAREEHTRVGKEAEERSRVELEKRSAAEFKKRANTLMDEFPDFAGVIEDAEGVMITETMGREIQDSPVGPRILYELAKNPEEAARIAELPQKAQVREILKLESRYEAEAAAKAKAKEKGKKNADGSEDDDEAGDDQQQQREDESADADGKGKGKDEDRDADGRFKAQEKGSRKAPDPIEPGTGRSANQDRGPTDKDTDSGWMAKRLAQEKAERARQRGK